MFFAGEQCKAVYMKPLCVYMFAGFFVFIAIQENKIALCKKVVFIKLKYLAFPKTRVNVTF